MLGSRGFIIMLVRSFGGAVEIIPLLAHCWAAVDLLPRLKDAGPWRVLGREREVD